MKVLKFGGTSVGSPERIKALLPLIGAPEPKIVVLSAMAGTTNALVEICSLLHSGQAEAAAGKTNALREKYLLTVNELYGSEEKRRAGEALIDASFARVITLFAPPFSKAAENEILAQGELISTALLQLLLEERKISSVLLPALNFMRIDKYGEPDSYYIAENLRRELKALPPAGIIVTQGFICRNASGAIDNLKRGGSDFSASLIGAAADSEEIQIWTDISGFHNNDPRHVENTSVLRELSFDEAAELAYFGAKILHPSSVNPAREKNIPVRLKNTMEPQDPGTLITARAPRLDHKAVAAKDGITALRIKSDRMLMAYGFLRKVFEIFEAHRTPIDMVTTSEVSVSLTIDNPAALDPIAAELAKFGAVEIERDLSIICVVGDFRPDRPGSAAAIFEALDTIPLKMVSYGASPNSISLLIETSQKVNALKLLSARLFGKAKQ